jgi:thiol-disulfide isomerase/thioredoxin
MLNFPPTKKVVFFISLLFSFTIGFAQKKIPVLKVEQLQKRISNTSDTLYIVNFWATWCVPCVKELPDFERIHTEFKTQKIKILLVTLDFKEDLKKRVVPFFKKTGYKSEAILLDETDGTFIDKICKDWSGAIPATLFIRNNQREFVGKKIDYEFLVDKIKTLSP